MANFSCEREKSKCGNFLYILEPKNNDAERKRQIIQFIAAMMIKSSSVDGSDISRVVVSDGNDIRKASPRDDNEEEDDDEDHDSIYRRGRYRDEKSKPTLMEMVFDCISCKTCVCLVCVLMLVLIAVTIGKSALQKQSSNARHAGVDEFGRKIDEDGNVVYRGRRAMMGIAGDDDDVSFYSYPKWIVNHCGWLLYVFALAYTLLGFRVLCGGTSDEKENAFLKKALDAVAFDLTFWLPRKINDSWIFDGPEQEIDVQKYEEEQYLPHEKANSCSRVSLILFFFGFVFIRESFHVSRVSVRRGFDGFRRRVVQLYHSSRDDAF